MRSTCLSRTAQLLLAGLLACVALAAPANSSSAAPLARADVTEARFASVAQVARVFSDYRRGDRQVFRSRQLSVTDPADCIGFIVGEVQPRAGGTASYNARDGESPFFKGGTGIHISVHEYATPARAQTSLDEQRTTIEACYGTHMDGGYGTRWERLAAPDLGQDEFAYRRIAIDARTGRDWFASALVRSGRFLVETNLQRDRNAPAAPPAFHLARISAKALR